MILTPEQIEAGMTRDEALKVAEALFIDALAAYHMHNPMDFGTGREAAATVIQQAFAERDREMREQVLTVLGFWRDQMPANAVKDFQALAAKGDSRG